MVNQLLCPRCKTNLKVSRATVGNQEVLFWCPWCGMIFDLTFSNCKTFLNLSLEKVEALIEGASNETSPS